MLILIDSSMWIEYFKGNETALPVNELIDLNQICINDLILSELIPSIIQRNEIELKELLMSITNIPITINWVNIIQMQIINLRNGINKVGIADLIIAQNAIENNVKLFAIDKHFSLMSELHGIEIYNP
jgi:predicted nucleic acid-binding protein